MGTQSRFPATARKREAGSVNAVDHAKNQHNRATHVHCTLCRVDTHGLLQGAKLQRRLPPTSIILVVCISVVCACKVCLSIGFEGTQRRLNLRHRWSLPKLLVGLLLPHAGGVLRGCRWADRDDEVDPLEGHDNGGYAIGWHHAITRVALSALKVIAHVRHQRVWQAVLKHKRCRLVVCLPAVGCVPRHRMQALHHCAKHYTIVRYSSCSIVLVVSKACLCWLGCYCCCS